MKITRRLDDAVAALIAKVHKALAARKKFRTAVYSCSKSYLPRLDNTSDLLAVAEDEQFK